MRIRRHMTQEKLAERANISLSFLGHIERGTRKLSVETLYHIAESLKCSTDELMGIFIHRDKKLQNAVEILHQAIQMAEENE